MSKEAKRRRVNIIIQPRVDQLARELMEWRMMGSFSHLIERLIVEEHERRTGAVPTIHLPTVDPAASLRATAAEFARLAARSDPRTASTAEPNGPGAMPGSSAGPA